MKSDMERVGIASQARPVALAKVPDAGTVRELQIDFRRGQVQISAEQLVRIQAWRVDWPMAADKVDVLLGGAWRTARVGRLRRLHGLIALLEQLGVAAKRIFPEIDWTKPVRMGSLDDMPADTVWLKLSPHARHRVMV